jgi:hypothetical protein
VDSRGDAEIAVNGRRLDAAGFAPLSGGARETLTVEVLSGKTDILSFTFTA